MSKSGDKISKVMLTLFFLFVVPAMVLYGVLSQETALSLMKSQDSIMLKLLIGAVFVVPMPIIFWGGGFICSWVAVRFTRRVPAGSDSN